MLLVKWTPIPRGVILPKIFASPITVQSLRLNNEPILRQRYRTSRDLHGDHRSNSQGSLWHRNLP